MTDVGVRKMQAGITYISVINQLRVVLSKNTNSFPVVEFVLQHILQQSGVEKYFAMAR